MASFTAIQHLLEASTMAEVLVGKASDMADGERVIVRCGHYEIGVFRWEGEFYAYENMCIHQGGPACEGILMHQAEEVVAEDKTWIGFRYNEDRINFVCPWHGYEYDLKTGRCIGEPKRGLRKFPLLRRGDEIYAVTE